MARSFSTSLVLPFKGVMAASPVSFCEGAQVATLDFSWRSYGRDFGTSRATYINPGVRFTVAQPPQVVLEAVQGVFIDNTACDSPVYLVAQDTGHMLTCADGTSAFFPVLTNGTDFVLYIESISAPFEKSQSTKLLFCNKPFPGYSDAQFNEFIPASQVSGDNAFAAAVQADQYSYEQVSLTTSSSQTGNVDSPSFIIIPAVTAFDNILVLSSVQAFVAYGRSVIERIANVRFYNSPSASGAELFKGACTLRLYNQPLSPRDTLVNIQNVALRLDGKLPLTCRARFNTTNPGSSGTANDGTSNFVVDVTVCYARIRVPTT